MRWGAHSWREGFLPSAQSGLEVCNLQDHVGIAPVPQPLYVQYFREPVAVDSTLFAYLDESPWGTAKVHPHAFKRGPLGRA